MRHVALIVVGAIVAVGCDSGSSGGGSGNTSKCGSGSSGGDGGTHNPECSPCLQANCSAAAEKCYGAGYATGNVSGGACQAYTSCASACGCNDLTCLQGCSSKLTPDCQACMQEFNTCEQTNCKTQCSSSSSTADP